MFAFLHAIGIYIEGSGIDQVFVDANVYGYVTVEQIMKGKHMKRRMEAYTTLYLTFHTLYLKEFFNKFPHMEEKLSSLLSSYSKLPKILMNQIHLIIYAAIMMMFSI